MNHLTAMRQRGRFAGFSLYVSNTTDQHRGHLCYKDGQELPLLDFNINCITHGRYVIFYNERLNGTEYPSNYERSPVFTELCEVTVIGMLTSCLFDFMYYSPNNSIIIILICFVTQGYNN